MDRVIRGLFQEREKIQEGKTINTKLREMIRKETGLEEGDERRSL